jgi:adenylate cyclase
MNEDQVKRKLTAILSADVKGYSRLMGEDEEATVRTITAYREVMTGMIKDQNGRVVDAKGDNLLAEFPSVVDAVRCAVEIQKQLRFKNDEIPENRRMEFRIGINLGDVIEEEKTIYGDGVNIAARLEGLAEGGGICISRMAFDSVKNKLDVGYEYLGEHSVKNIAEPVRAYKVLMEPGYAREVIGEEMPKPKQRRWAAVAIGFIIVVVAMVIWHFYFRLPFIEPASVEKMAYPLPDKPSIAVLAFVNMSDDPKQEIFCDGITEEIITGLSKVTELFVIARKSSFTYKGKPVKVQQVAQDLGVRYVLEGSVRKSKENLRITAQLIDAIKGHHLWADRWDRELKDVFAIQDEITMKITTAMQVKLTTGEQARMVAKGTNNLDAYLKVLEANENVTRFNQESNTLARQLAKEAINLDPEYAYAYTILGKTYMLDVWLGTTRSPKQSIARAIKLAQRSIAVDESLGRARGLLGFLYTMTGQNEKGIMEAESAITLEPNSDLAHQYLGLALRFGGRPNEAIPVIKKAIRLNPSAPGTYLFNLGLSYLFSGQYEEAIGECKKATTREPDNLGAQIALIVAYGLSGRDEEARATASEVLRINPEFSLEYFTKTLAYKNQADRDRYIGALRKAGLPETPPLPLPDKPSIAVLPFTNMSDDPKQDFFSDGLTEEIITALSKAPQLFVIASNTSFTYKGKPVKVKKVGKDLGIQYVIEGSVRRMGERIRVTAQMIDALKDRHLWAERYDKEFKDVFSIQDDITKKIITAVHVKLTEGERARVFAKGTSNLQAYLTAVQADWFVNQATKDSVLRAQQLAEEAIALDPNYAYAHMTLGSVQIYYLFLGMSQSPRDTLMRAIKQYQKAVALNPESGEAHALLAYGLVMARQYDKAVAECERAMVLEPNSYKPLYHCASALTFVGRREEAITMFREALRINPKPPNSCYRHFGVALRDSGQYDEAIELSKKATERKPNDIIAYVVLASSYGLAGREEEAKAAAKEILRINPKYSVDRLEKVSPHKDRAVAKRFCDALRKSGLK